MSYWILTICLIGIAVTQNIFIGVPLTLVLFLFVWASIRKKTPIPEIKAQIVSGGKTSLSILWMLLLIAVNTASWLSSGCIAALIQYGFIVLKPAVFLPASFLLCAGVSYLLGSAFATASTIGIVLYMIGCVGGVPAGIIMGAILSGTYVGDRCSPISSPLFLLSRITDIPHQTAIRAVGRSGLIPLFLTALAFMGLSVLHPIHSDFSELTHSLSETFQINLITVLPAILLLGFSLLRVGMTGCLAVSSITACFLSIVHQGHPPLDVLSCILTGFHLAEGHALREIIKGGGILPMLPSIYVVFVSCALAAIFQKGDFLPAPIKVFLDKSHTRAGLNWRGAVLGIAASAIGCNQTMAVVTTVSFMRDRYEENQYTDKDLLLDVSFGSSLLSTLPPWSLAVSLPLTALRFEGYSYIPFMLFMYISFAYHMVWCCFQDRHNPCG